MEATLNSFDIELGINLPSSCQISAKYNLFEKTLFKYSNMILKQKYEASFKGNFLPYKVEELLPLNQSV